MDSATSPAVTDQAPREAPMSPRRALPLLLDRQQGRCADCGIKLAHLQHAPQGCQPAGPGAWTAAPGWVFATVDHVIPRSAGGLNRLSNYEATCGPCNTARFVAHRAAQR